MPPIINLPTELILFVAGNFDDARDIASFSCTNRRFYEALNPVLYECLVRQQQVLPLAWAAHTGVASTLRKILAAGADPNAVFVDDQPADAWKNSIAAARSEPSVDESLPAWEPSPYESSDDAEPTNQWAHIPNANNHSATPSHHQEQQPAQPGYDAEPLDIDPMDDDSESEADDLLVTNSFEPIPEDDADSSTLGYSNGSPSSVLVTRTFTPLHLAARGGHNEAICILLEYGASIDSPSANFCDCKRAAGLLNTLESPMYDDRIPPYWTPLHAAICHSRLETAKLLLSRNASSLMESLPADAPATQENCGITALHHAAGMGQVDLVRLLVDEGFQLDIDVRDARTLTPFYYAYANNQWDSTIPLLLSMEANINIDIDFYQPYCTITPVGESIRLGNFDIAQKLIQLGANITYGFYSSGTGHRKGLSPLHLCCMPSARSFTDNPNKVDVSEDESKSSQRIELMEVLIARGTPISQTDCMGDAPLITASQNKVLAAVRALIKAGADIHARSAVGRTAAMMALLGAPIMAAGRGQHEYSPTMAQILDELFEHGARIEDTDPLGNTLAHHIFSSSLDMPSQVQALRHILASPSTGKLALHKNNDGQTPFHLAFRSMNIDACEFFLRRGYVRAPLPHDELVAMYRHASSGHFSQQSMEFVLDLDVNNELIADSALFIDLLSGGGSSALGSHAIARRGFPPLHREECTKLLPWAIHFAEWEVAHNLIRNGADVNAVSPDGDCVLSTFIQKSAQYASAGGVGRTLRLLLGRGANIHLAPPGCPRLRPLSRAIQLGSAAWVKLLLENQPLRNDPRAIGGLYLHQALKTQPEPLLDIEMVHLLAKSGASLTEQDENGDMPLALLLERLCGKDVMYPPDHLRLARTLFGPGVDVNRPNKQGRTVADYVEEMLPPKNNTDVGRLLARIVQLRDGLGGKELVFLPKSRPKLRPSDVWSLHGGSR